MAINRTQRGLTIVEVLITVLVLAMLLAIVLPALARGQQDAHITTSLNNLRQINTALADYVADFDGRQPTAVVDDFSTYGMNGLEAVNGYLISHQHAHPPLILGEECTGATWGYYMPGHPGVPAHPENYTLAVPIELTGTSHFGYFRALNSRIMHGYVGYKFYNSAFYAPNDWLTHSYAQPWFDYPCEFAAGTVAGANQPIWSSYCFSPAAMFDPLVMRAPSAGGYTDPYSYADGFRSPAVSQALHPALKTRVLEYRWNQNQPPVRCNPNFPSGPYDDCDPWFFNHGAASEPATLFFDGSTRLLPNSEVIADDAALIAQTGEGLWHRETPLGPNGYYGEFAYDGTLVSHHILTIDGIQGRDTLGAKP